VNAYDHQPSLELSSIRRTTRRITVGLAFFVAGMMALFHGAVPGPRMYAWAVLMAVYLAARAWLTQRHAGQTQLGAFSSLAWRRRQMAAMSTFLGCLLGSLAWVAFPFLDLTARVILTFMVLLVCNAATYTVAHSPFALLGLRLPAILPFAVAWSATTSPYQFVAPLLLLLTAVRWSVYARDHSHAERERWDLITRNEQLASELRHRNEELQASDATKNRLFAVAGHDLRQPIHAIGLTIDQIRQDMEPTLFRQHMNRLRQAAHLASVMLHNLMDFSNLERKDFAARHESVALGPLLDQVRESLGALANAKNLYLHTSRSAHLLAVSSDPNLMRRMLMNLVSNAIKYTAAGGVSIDCEREGDDVVIRVRDTGIGIPPEHLQDVFNDYVRVGGTARKDDGLGLGLSVVRRAAQLLGHRLSLTSTPGQGSVFEVRAPFVPLPVQETVPASLYASLPEGEVVLVVEDDEYAREALCGLLAQWGFVPAAGASAREALYRLGPSQRPAMIITDYQLSASEDGFDCIGLVRSTTGAPRLPALLMTGDISPSIKPRAAAASVSVAHKPITPPMLRQRIQALLAGSPQEA
jgi:signal transduction histidine kinase/CheY-like chemotaxis protein